MSHPGGHTQTHRSVRGASLLSGGVGSVPRHRAKLLTPATFQEAAF